MGNLWIYPVISAKHYELSFKNLLMDDYTCVAKLKNCSIESCIDESSSPAYIFHASNDECADVKNSLALANALADKGINFEMHIYPDAPHGVALGNEITKCGVGKWCNPAISKWVENAVIWAKSL